MFQGTFLALFHTNQIFGGFVASIRTMMKVQSRCRPYFFDFASAGFHHDSVPASLLERRAAGVSVPKQSEQDVRLQACEEDLGSRRLLRPLQALLHPRHHYGEHHATGLPRRKHPLQR